MTISNFLFYMFSITLIISATMVVISQHPVFSLLFLILSFIMSSCILFLLECEFLALIFVLVYVGAIAVLFLFAIMMLESKQANLSKNSIKYVPAAFILSLFLLFFMLFAIQNQYSLMGYLDNLFLNSYQNWYDLIDSISDVEIYGQVLYSYFVLQFLLAGLILLVVLVGVIYLTNLFNNQKTNEQSLFKQLARTAKIYF
jgi:NADH-quinone oxidoreductase subunit J